MMALRDTEQSSKDQKSRREAFSKVEFIHEGRHANFDAHLLARSSVSISFGRHVWFLSP